MYTTPNPGSVNINRTSIYSCSILTGVVGSLGETHTHRHTLSLKHFLPTAHHHHSVSLFLHCPPRCLLYPSLLHSLPCTPCIFLFLLAASSRLLLYLLPASSFSPPISRCLTHSLQPRLPSPCRISRRGAGKNSHNINSPSK